MSPTIVLKDGRRGRRPHHHHGDPPRHQQHHRSGHEFCAWLGKKEHKTYLLPTDKEWSLAVGIGDEEKWTSSTTPETIAKSQAAFTWGSQWPPPAEAGNYSDQSRKEKAPSGAAQYIEGYDDGYPTTSPVVSFAPNSLGLYDMGGNAWQWCEDLWDIEQGEHVLRGGSWDRCERGFLLSSSRLHHNPDMRGSNWGFRVVMVPESAVASGN